MRHSQGFAALMITLLLAPCSGFAASDGLFADIGIGRAEDGSGSRASLGIGYNFRSGWGVYASSQKLSQAYASLETVVGGEPPVFEEIHPEGESKSLMVSYGRDLGESSLWSTRFHAGVHRWDYDFRFSDPTFQIPLDTSGSDPVARIEIERRLATRASLGAAVERFWLGGTAVARGSVFVRVHLGGVD